MDLRLHVRPRENDGKDFRFDRFLHLNVMCSVSKLLQERGGGQMTSTMKLYFYFPAVDPSGKNRLNIIPIFKRYRNLKSFTIYTFHWVIFIFFFSCLRVVNFNTFIITCSVV